VDVLQKLACRLGTTVERVWTAIALPWSPKGCAKSTPRSSAPSAPDVGLTSNRVFRMAVAPVGQFSLVRKPSKLRGLLRQFDIRLVDHLGISRGVRGIEICKLAGAHRFECLQALTFK